MTQILAGQFDDLEHANVVVDDLRALGIAADDVETFVLNAPGQHDLLPIGGDQNEDSGARDGDSGAVAGAALGGAAGLALGAAVIPLVGPLAAAAGLAVGAYTGSFAGAVGNMGDEVGNLPEAPTTQPATPAQTIPRPAGVRVVVHVPTAQQRSRVVATLKLHGARSIEEADGNWRDGSWVDFSPVSVPNWVQPPAR